MDGGNDSIGTYLHECWHAADSASYYSNQQEWQAAYLKEICRGKQLFSRQALENASEGLAEFGRVLASPSGEAYLQTHFPACLKFCKEKGLA